ncbi:mechanosensitive ion channel domain-containing protein [Heminiphilus faecis]|uniref:Mechanosensitive ion channel domain-containing protein n=1 Tax=Heminiphilus faecis TaxID=2601703 RepID=A0ABV4CUL8_9BACT
MFNTQFDQLVGGAASQFAAPDNTAVSDSIAAAKTGGLKALESMSLDDLMSRMVNGLVEFAIHLAIAILVFYVGKFIITKIYKVVDAIFLRRNLDRSLATFILSLIRILLYFILIITVIGILGINTSSFLAIFASAGVAIGLALSGTLQNFAGGVLILLLKPYKIGDYIEAQGYAGSVKEIQIFSTIINTPDNKQIIIPNGPLSTSSINNYSKEDYRRVDWTVSVAYGDDVDVAIGAIKDILLSDKRVVVKYIEDDRKKAKAATAPKDEAVAVDVSPEAMRKIPWWRRMFMNRKRAVTLGQKIEAHHAEILAKMPKVNREPFVRLGNLNSSSIDLTVRAWTRAENYWDVFYTMNERFYRELPAHGLHFPFPQLDVHMDPTAK